MEYWGMGNPGDEGESGRHGDTNTQHQTPITNASPALQYSVGSFPCMIP